MRRRREFAHQGLPISEGSSSPLAGLSLPVCLLQHTKAHFKTISPPQINTNPNRYFSRFPLFSPFIPVTSSSNKSSPDIPLGTAPGQFAAVTGREMPGACLPGWQLTHTPGFATERVRVRGWAPNSPPGFFPGCSQTPFNPLRVLWPRSTRMIGHSREVPAARIPPAGMGGGWSRSSPALAELAPLG